MSDAATTLPEATVWTSRSERETEAIGAELASRLPDGTVLLLSGDLGAGKTVLVRGLACALGVDRRQVQSPSYGLIHEYQGGTVPVVHVDLYRLEPEDVPSLGLDELLAGPGLKAVEWAERLPETPPRAVRVTLAAEGESRRIELRAVEP